MLRSTRSRPSPPRASTADEGGTGSAIGEQEKRRSFLVRLDKKLGVPAAVLVSCLLGLPALIFALKYVWHRISAYQESHRPWSPAPIVSVERDCPKPEYETLERTPEKAGKICITTLTDAKRRATIQKLYGWRSFSGLIELSWKNKFEYAKRHGYALYDESNLMDNSRPPGWSKIHAARRLLTEENCTWVFWLDADTVIMNPTKKVEDILPADTRRDLVMTPDLNMKNGYSSGAWMLRNSEWSLEFLDRWWSQTKYVRKVGISKSGDQAGMNAALRKPSEFDEQGRGVAPKQCTFNSFAKVLNPNEYAENVEHLKEKDYYLSEYYYHKGDFIAHAAGVDNKEDVMKMMLESAS